MKAGFSLTSRYVPDWNKNKSLPEKDQLVATLSMPTVQDVFSILDRFSANGVTGAVDTSVSLGMKRNTAIAAEAGEYLPKYVKLEGNEDFSVEDLVKYPPYFALAVELLFALVSYAQPNEADENSQ